MPASPPALAQPGIAVATNAAGPTSIAPSLGSPSTQGNLLILVVAVGGSSTITTPVNWTPVFNASGSNVSRALFLFPNNPGGIQTVTINFTAQGGAVAALLEIANIGSSQNSDFSIQNTISVFNNLFPRVISIGEFHFYAECALVGGITRVLTYEWTTSVNAASTNGSSNVQVNTFFAVNNGTDNPNVSVSASPAAATFGIRFPTPFGGSIAYGPGGSVYVGAGGNPAGNLQVPQTQGMGSFYSGSTGG